LDRDSSEADPGNHQIGLAQPDFLHIITSQRDSAAFNITMARHIYPNDFTANPVRVIILIVSPIRKSRRSR
jgi:hypothetical protein